ncbi:MAG TPA: SigB/SigF/SigG family RNA polymerase sigma factor [Acidimicrobiales bacterium]|nr:SigB/SigF/SigG family RNA polymerase sigma factor [Acidimicrobiales bacterium]
MSLGRSDEDALLLTFHKFATTRDPALRDQLVEAHLGLAEYLARRFSNRGESLDDLVQVASLGLLKAVERFDPDRGLRFTTFATPTIVGELKRHFRDNGWALRVPRRVQELRLRVTGVSHQLQLQLGRSPTVAEIAQRAGTTEDEVIEAIDAGSAYRCASLDAGQSDDEESPGLLGVLGQTDPELMQAERKVAIHPLMAKLPKREQVMLYLRFYENKTQSEIAKRLGISQMHVSRRLAQSFEQLRKLAEL